MVADATPVELMGSAYGLRQSLDNLGAFIGPSLATAFMVLSDDNFRRVFWLAVIPGVISVGILILFVKETTTSKPKDIRQTIHYRNIMGLGTPYWLTVSFGAVFTLARFSEAFLLLQAENVGVSPSVVPIILLILSAAYALSAYPVGLLSDRVGRTGLIIIGIILLISADSVLASAKSGWHVSIGAILWGLHMGFTQGLLSALVANAATPELRGTAFGVFSMACGIAMLVGCLLAGWLWDIFGAPATFIFGATFAVMSLIGFIILRKRVEIR
jgi:MFS family permease